MTEHCYGGIDVSKDRLDVMVLPDRKSFSVDNNAAGYSELVKRLRGLSIVAIGIEPSGGYERAVIRALLAADLSVRRINPNKLRQFGGEARKLVNVVGPAKFNHDIFALDPAEIAQARPQRLHSARASGRGREI